MCVSHGGGKRCSIVEMINQLRPEEGAQAMVVERGAVLLTVINQTGGKCASHGGGKRCSVVDCPKFAQSGEMCISHGDEMICTII